MHKWVKIQQPDKETKNKTKQKQKAMAINQSNFLSSKQVKRFLQFFSYFIPHREKKKEARGRDNSIPTEAFEHPKKKKLYIFKTTSCSFFITNFTYQKNNEKQKRPFRRVSLNAQGAKSYQLMRKVGL